MRRSLVALAVAAALALPVSHAFAQQATGTATFRTTVILADTLVVSMADINPAPGGSHYEGWLRSADGSQRVDLGAVPVTDGKVDFTYVSPRSENLLGANSVFEMSTEPDSDADPNPNGPVAYRGQLADALLPAAREMLFRWPDSRFGTPAAGGLNEDAQLLDKTAGELQQAAESGDLAAAKKFAERLVNTVEGQGGANYGDHNADGQAEGPGDGTGALNYAWGSYWRAKVAVDVSPGDARIAASGNAVAASAQQCVNQLAFLRDNGLAFQGVSDPQDAKTRAADLKQVTDRLLNGFDANGDSTIAPDAGEGGAKQILDGAEQMLAIQVGPAA